jgi:hypothetical protein
MAHRRWAIGTLGQLADFYGTIRRLPCPNKRTSHTSAVPSLHPLGFDASVDLFPHFLPIDSDGPIGFDAQPHGLAAHADNDDSDVVADDDGFLWVSTQD